MKYVISLRAFALIVASVSVGTTVRAATCDFSLDKGGRSRRCITYPETPVYSAPDRRGTELCRYSGDEPIWITGRFDSKWLKIFYRSNSGETYVGFVAIDQIDSCPSDNDDDDHSIEENVHDF
jgi:hypothetical protein